MQRYPEVLEYFYGLVDLSLPGDSEEGVRDPPLSALIGGAGAAKRGRVRVGDGGRRRSRVETTVDMGMEPPRRQRRRPEVAFAPMPEYGYVQPPGY